MQQGSATILSGYFVENKVILLVTVGSFFLRCIFSIYSCVKYFWQYSLVVNRQ